MAPEQEHSNNPAADSSHSEETEHSSHGRGAHGHGGGHEEGHEGAPEWLISFADNVTLMMGFFVILLALNLKPAAPAAAAAASESESTSETAKSSSEYDMIDVILGIRDAFHHPVDVNSSKANERMLVQRLRERATGSTEDGIKGNKSEVQSLRDSGYRHPSGFVFFSPDSSLLSPESQDAIAQFAKPFQGLRLMIEVHGRASSAESFGRDDAGTRLSLDRALAVSRQLVKQGLDWKQLRLVVHGNNEPFKSRDLPSNSHAQNACVEIVVTDDILKE